MPNEINEETIRLAGEGAEELQIVSVVNKNPALMKSVVAIRALIAKASETCERIKQLEKVAAHQHAMLEDLACHTACSCDAAFTGRGRHEPNSLCHLDAEMVAVLQEYRKLVETKQEQGTKERT